MERSVLALCLATMACVACGEAGSPAGPTSARPAATSTVDEGTAPSAPTAAATPRLLFEGRLQGEADPPDFEPPPSPYFSAHLSAEGHATQLGPFVMDFSHRVNVDTLAGRGKAIFTAANGDELRTDVDGTASPAGTPTAFTVVEIHTVTGGTGRFIHATGQFTMTRAVDFADPFTSGTFSGWIVVARGRL